MKLVRVTVGWIIIVWNIFFFKFINSFVFCAELDKPIESETKSDTKVKLPCMFFSLSQWEGAGHLLWFVLSSFLEKSVNSTLLWITICLIYSSEPWSIEKWIFCIWNKSSGYVYERSDWSKTIVYSTCKLAPTYLFLAFTRRVMNVKRN